MKKIIHGKKYNTDTATLIGEHCYGYPRDFAHYDDQLYRKKTGEFFIYGEGGPASKYAESLGPNSGWSSGSDIVPITEDEAREWAEKYMDVDEYEKVFGAVEE